MKAYGKIILFLLVTEILTLFINLTLSVFTGTVFRVISSICTVGILLALMIQAGCSIGAADKKAQNAGEKGTAPVIAGITASLPLCILWGLLLLEKCGIFPAGYYRFYKLLCAPFLQICNLFSADVTADTLPWAGVITLGLLSLLPAAAVVISRHMVMQGRQLEELMYRK